MAKRKQQIPTFDVEAFIEENNRNVPSSEVMDILTDINNKEGYLLSQDKKTLENDPLLNAGLAYSFQTIDKSYIFSRSHKNGKIKSIMLRVPVVEKITSNDTTLIAIFEAWRNLISKWFLFKNIQDLTDEENIKLLVTYMGSLSVFSVPEHLWNELYKDLEKTLDPKNPNEEDFIILTPDLVEVKCIGCGNIIEIEQNKGAIDCPVCNASFVI